MRGGGDKGRNEGLLRWEKERMDKKGRREKTRGRVEEKEEGNRERKREKGREKKKGRSERWDEREVISCSKH